MSLHQINYDTRRAMYCGPTAICAVTGFAASAVLREIEDGRGENAIKMDGIRKGVRGMHIAEVVETLRRLGCEVQHRRMPSPYKTVAAYCNGILEQANFSRIIRIRGHFIAVDGVGGHVCDTRTKQPVPSKSGPYRRAFVTDDILIIRNWND